MVRKLAFCLLAVYLTAVFFGVDAAADTRAQRRVRFNRAVVAFQQGDYAAAQRLFTELVFADEADVASLYWLGLCQLQGDDHAAAADSFARVMELAPDHPAVKFDAAVALTGQEQYEQSRQLLLEYIAAQPRLDDHTRRLAHFFLGVAEYKTGNYAEALAALAVAEEGTTDATMLANIGWYRGWIYTEQGDFEQSSQEFWRVSELSPNLDQKARARSLAEQVKSGMAVEEEEVSRLQFRLDFGLSYDTNIVLLGDDTSLPVGLSTDDDLRIGVATDVRYLHPVAEKWLIGVAGNTFHSWHASLGEFNVQTYGGRVFVNYFADERTTFGLQYGFDFSTVDNSAFLSRHRITPSLRYVESFHEDGTPLTATTVFYSYEPRDYHEPLNDLREDRDGNYHTLGITQSFNLSQPRLDDDDPRWLSAAVGYRWLNESTQGDDFDLTGSSLTASASAPLPHDLLFNFSGQWTWEDYWQSNTQDFRRRNRHDFIQRYILSLGRIVELDRHITLSVRAEIAWTDDDSNIRNRLGEAVFSYDRVIYGLTLSFLFR